MHGTAGWWRRRSLRARVTLVSTLGLALALLAVALLLRAELRASLSNGLDTTARQGAREVAALADAHRLPDPVPVADGTITLQVLNAQGRIVDASPGADRLVPLLPPGQAAANARAGRTVLLDGRPYDLPGLVRVVAVATRGGETVIAAVAYDQELNSLAALTRALLIGTPLLLLLLAGASWLVVGTTLRPIAELRRGAQDVTRTGRPSALPIPEAHDEVHSLGSVGWSRTPRTNCAARSPVSAPSWRSHSTIQRARTGGRPRAMCSRTLSGWPGWPRISWFSPGSTSTTAAAPPTSRSI